MSIMPSGSRRRVLRPAALVLVALAGCAQPADAPATAPENQAASVAHLRMTAERIAAELPERARGVAYPAPPPPSDAPLQQISQAEWKRLEEAARRELPSLIAEVEALAAQR